MDISYNSHDAQSVLRKKYVVIIGDSNQRGIYKDLVLLLRDNRLLNDAELKRKGEISFHFDQLIEGGCKGEMSNRITYTEVREYVTLKNVHRIKFYFVTRCYNDYVKSILDDFKNEPYPDIVIMNSCLWDITNYGKSYMFDYKKNLVTLFDHFKRALPPHCRLIWNTSLPISDRPRGGVLGPGKVFQASTLHYDIWMGNHYASLEAMKHGFGVLDLYLHLCLLMHRQERDGIHWDVWAHRHITCLLLRHISWSFGIPDPNNAFIPFHYNTQQRHHMDMNFNCLNNHLIKGIPPPGYQNGQYFMPGWHGSWNWNRQNSNQMYPPHPFNNFGSGHDDRLGQNGFPGAADPVFPMKQKKKRKKKPQKKSKETLAHTLEST